MAASRQTPVNEPAAPIHERLLDYKDLSDDFLVDEGTSYHARVHPRWSDILLVNLKTLKSLLGPETVQLCRGFSLLKTIFRAFPWPYQVALGLVAQYVQKHQNPSSMHLLLLSLELQRPHRVTTVHTAYLRGKQYSWNAVECQDLWAELVVSA